MARDPSTPPPTTQPRYVNSARSRTTWALHVVFPRAIAGLEQGLEADVVLGRLPPTVLLDETVSRRHAVVCVASGGLALRDLGSRNGTTVDGQPASVARSLVSQAVVRVGDVLGVVDQTLADDVETNPQLYEALPGRAPAMVRLRSELAGVGPEPLSVLILGETGTGKERAAGAIHRSSGREGPFIAVSCAEITPQLFESELFGYERGAFTGAHLAREGLIRAASGGTLFLDEIGELPLELQPKLLRVLQEGEVRPVGATTSAPVDVRVVAATNRSLAVDVEAGRFRRDLYARLAFFELRLPALRERRIDIFAWVQCFWEAQQNAGRFVAPLAFTPDAAERVLRHGWPDNLRGLERLVHRVAASENQGPVSLARLERLMPELLGPAAETSKASNLETRPGVVEKPRARPGARPSRDELLAAYAAAHGSVHALSKTFGKDRRQIYRWLRDIGIERRSTGNPE